MKSYKVEKLKTYRVNYNFDGRGSAIVEAESETEAEAKFYDGEFIDDQDNSENYDVYSVFEDKPVMRLCGKCATNPKYNKIYTECEHFKG